MFYAGVVSNSPLSNMNREYEGVEGRMEAPILLHTWIGDCGSVSTNAADDACSECDCFPLEQETILIQIDAGHFSTVLTYKCTLILLLKVLDYIHFKIFFQINLALSSMYSSNMDLLLVSIFVWILKKFPLQVFLYEDSAAASSPKRIGSVHSACLITAFGALLLFNFPVSQTLSLFLLHSNLEHGTLV